MEPTVAEVMFAKHKEDSRSETPFVIIYDEAHRTSDDFVRQEKAYHQLMIEKLQSALEWDTKDCKAFALR